MATLQNVLHHVPNIVPQLQCSADAAGDTADTDHVPHDSASTRVGDGAPQGGDIAAAAADSVHVTLSPDRDGAYVNPITDTADPDNVEAMRHRTESRDSTASNKRLVRQQCTVVEEDVESVKNPDGGGLDEHDAGSASVSLASDEDALVHSTLHTYLRMVSTQSIEGCERSETNDASNKGNSLPEVISFLLTFVCYQGFSFLDLFTYRSHIYLGYIFLAVMSDWHQRLCQAHTFSFCLSDNHFCSYFRFGRWSWFFKQVKRH